MRRAIWYASTVVGLIGGFFVFYTIGRNSATDELQLYKSINEIPLKKLVRDVNAACTNLVKSTDDYLSVNKLKEVNQELERKLVSKEKESEERDLKISALEKEILEIKQQLKSYIEVDEVFQLKEGESKTLFFCDSTLGLLKVDTYFNTAEISFNNEAKKIVIGNFVTKSFENKEAKVILEKLLYEGAVFRVIVKKQSQ